MLEGVGLVRLPDGWLQKTVSDVVEFRNGKAHENIIDDAGKYIVINSKFISSGGKEFKRCKENLAPLFVNDIVMVMSDIPNGKALAKCFLVKDANKYTLNQRICSLKSLDEVNAEYFFYYLNRNKYFLSFDSGVGQTNLRKEEILDCPVLLPPIAEQKRIAMIFSVWDRAIEILGKLIDVKARFKKGLMQELLTGKIRFKQFNEKWKTAEVGDLIDYEQPAKYLVDTVLDYDENLTPVLTANKSFILGSTNDKNGIYTDLPVIIFDDFTTDSKYVDFLFKVKSSAIKILKIKNAQINLRFIYEAMKIVRFPSGAEHKRYFISEYQYVTIDIPSFDEQVAIGNLAKTIDTEISGLKQKLALLTAQKNGLMQKLLTGKIRVKDAKQ